MINIGGNLKKYRKVADLTQQQVADSIGVSKGAIGHWENNKRFANLIIIKKLAELYKTTPSNLIGDYVYNNNKLEPANLLDKIIVDLATEGYFKNDTGFEELDKPHQQILIGALNCHIQKILNK